MINLRTIPARRKEHANQERLRSIYEKRMSILLARELRRFYAGGSSATNLSVHRTNLARILRSAYGQIFDAFGAKVFQAVRNKKEDEDDLAIARRKFIEKNVGRKVKEISNTSQEKLQRIVDRGEEQDLSYGEIADMIEEELGGDFADRRAMTIARTETHGASQDGQFEAAQATGLNLRKRWVSIDDNRTRPDHADADGQVVDMEESFQVGESELLYAGDPNGDAEQVINCRCITVYEEASSAD